jgi:hypothetical protein
MENNKKKSLIKRFYVDLPKISNVSAFMKENSMEENVVKSPRFKDLRKLFFQYKSNAKILQTSPYYSNRHEQKKLV